MRQPKARSLTIRQADALKLYQAGITLKGIAHFLDISREGARQLLARANRTMNMTSRRAPQR